MTDPKRTCGNCDYFTAGANGHGTCHVAAPGSIARNGFPIIAAGDWCAKGATSDIAWHPNPTPITIEFADKCGEVQEQMLAAIKEANAESERWFSRVLQLASRNLWQRICNTVPWEGK